MRIFVCPCVWREKVNKGRKGSFPQKSQRFFPSKLQGPDRINLKK